MQYAITKWLFCLLAFFGQPERSLPGQVSGQATYRIHTDDGVLDQLNQAFTDKFDDPAMADRALTMVRQMAEIEPQLQFKFEFNSEQGSRSTYVAPVDAPEHILNLALLAGDLRDAYLYDLRSGEVKRLRTEAGDQLIITDLPAIEWQLRGDTSRVISGYNCLAAVGKTIHTNRKGEQTVKERLAWYAPSIPLPFGPGPAVGLPGMVLAYRISPVKELVLEKLTFDESRRPLDLDPPGKTITYQALQQRARKRMN